MLRLRGIPDIEAHVWERMVTVCRVWPGLTPFNVWDLTISGWLVFAAAADKWSEGPAKGAPR